MGAARAPYMAKTDKERLATGFWNRIESNQATDSAQVIPNDMKVGRILEKPKRNLLK